MTSPVNLLTVRHLSHILDETVDNLESLRRGYTSFVLGESVYPLEYSLDALLSEDLLENFFCVSSSQVM
jgi:hypothetical protein